MTTATTQLGRLALVALLAAIALGLFGATPSGVHAAGPRGWCLSSGQRLSAGDYLEAGTNGYRLIMQGDGNLVAFTPGGRPVWNSRTWGNQGAYAELQSGDGNLVVYTSSRKALWDSKTYSNPGDRLCMQSDGNVVIYASSGSALWATQTWLAATDGRTLSYNPGIAGHCTWGAEFMFEWYTGSGRYLDATSGDAKVWARNAQEKGWSVGTRPRIGAMVVFQPSVAGAGAAGHVAFVTQVWPSRNAIQVREMNVAGLGMWNYRTISPAIDTGVNRYSGLTNINYIYVDP
jgi:surface antigen